MNAAGFRAMLERDFARFVAPRPWIVQWACAPDFHRYRGPEDLCRWFEWFGPCFHYFDESLVESLADSSQRRNEKILAEVRPSGAYTYRNVDLFSACDYILQTAYPVPPRHRVRKILDFGAGFGRMANLWCQKVPDLVYLAIDAVELSYCMQNFYLARLGPRFIEYADDPAAFVISDEAGLHHLPTWRDDLLPANFFDLVVASQVLPELHLDLAVLALETFRRVLKPGGALYIRDHHATFHPGNDMDRDRLLANMGFRLEFRPYLRDAHDVHGLPEIWRKADPIN
jgi:SAM-dependent methyltransferase